MPVQGATVAPALGKLSRWWLNTALARRAFGATTVPVKAGAAQAHRATYVGAPEPAVLDLDDPDARNFGDYTLQVQVGRGGMGTVYRAHQHSLDREVAVKLLSAGIWASADFVEGLRREARHAARMQHPNIVSVFEIGEQQGVLYYVMPLVEGRSLAERIDADGPLPPREAVALLRTIAEAVDYAHRMNVLHLDLKPGNVMLDAEGAPRITDFGLARRFDLDEGVDNERVSGTPSYMAPEQVQVHGDKLSPATDIWGLGAILYEALTGHPPFEGTDPQGVVDLVATGVVRTPKRYLPGLADDLDAIAMHCLARVPDERYPSARALADDLGRFLEGRAVSVRPLNAMQRIVRWARREPQFAFASGLAVLALVVGLGATTQQWQRAEINATTARQQTWRTRSDAAWRLVDDGRTFEAMPLLVENLEEREANGDAPGAVLERLRLGALQRGGAQLIDAIATGVSGRAVDVDRAGKRVAVADLDEVLRLYAVADGRVLWKTSVRQATHFGATDFPLTRVDFSRDGRRLITASLGPPSFVRPHGRNNVLVDAASGHVLAPPAGRFADFVDATYDAGGRYALLRNKAGEAQLFKVDGWQPLTPRRPFQGLGGSWLLGDGGRYIAHANSNSRLELLETRRLTSLHAWQFGQSDALRVWAAQPAGGQLALGRADGTVSLLDSASLAMRDLKPEPYNAIETLSFSQDGRWLVAGGGGRVFVWDVASGLGGVLPGGRPIEASRLQADAATGTVFAFRGFPSDAVLWRLPELTDGTTNLRRRIDGARILVPQFPLGGSGPLNSAAYAPAANLAVNLERNGELRLWRWRDGRPLDAHGPVQMTDELPFDGHHVVAIDGATAHVVTVDGERQASPALIHPQPVSLAELTPDGRTLVTVSGRELRAFDWRKGQLRFAPVTLAGSPLRVAISPDSGILLATTGGYRGNHYNELVSTFDLRSGAALAQAIPLPGPLNGLRFSPDGHSLVHWRYGEVEVRDSRGLHPIGKPLHFGKDYAAALRSADWKKSRPGLDAGVTPIVDAGISQDGSRLTLVLEGSEPEKPRLLQTDIHSGRTLRSRELAAVNMSRLWPSPDGYGLVMWYSNGAARWVDDHGGDHALQHAPGDWSFPLAVSGDGRWIATSSADGVLLADRNSGEWATGLLTAQLPLGDAIAQLAFAPDGSSLLARSLHGRWIWWPLAPEKRPALQLAAHMRHLRPPDIATTEVLANPLPRQERTVLRAADPGQPHPASVRHASPVPPVGTAAPGFAFVDLRPAINRPVDASGLFALDPLGHFSSLPLGMQRFLGTDFDIQGVIALRMQEAPQPSVPLPARSASIRPPRPRFSALNLLLGECCLLPMHPAAAQAYLLLRYQDGSAARIPIMNGRDVWGGPDMGDALPARIAWTGTASGFPDGFDARLYAARLANPHPDRAVASIAFEAAEFFASGPLVFAVTAELPPAAIAAAGPSRD